MGRFQNRYQESESGGFVPYMDWDAAGITAKQMYSPPKNGRMMIDIVPYVIATKNHPLVAKKKGMKVGDLDYMLDIYVHQNVGPNRAAVVCLRNFNRVCPICEFRKERLKIGGKDDEQAEALKGKRRVIYNVLDATSDSMRIKVFEVSHFLFEKEVLDEAKAEGERMGLAYLDYADPDEGYTIKCRTSEDDTGAYTFVKFKNFSFEKREQGIITPELIEKAWSLDKYMNILSAEEMESLLYSPDEPIGREEDEDEEEAPRSRRRSTDEDDDPPPRSRRRTRNEDEEDEGEEDAPSRRSRKRTSSEEEEEDEPPRRRSRSVPDEVDEEETPRRRSRGASKEEDDDDEDEAPSQRRKRQPPDEEEEEDPPPKKKRKGDDCPYDHEFGVDTDKFDDCDECEVWDQCAAQLKKNKRKSK